MEYSVLIENDKGERKLFPAIFENDEDIINKFTTGCWSLDSNRSSLYNSGDMCGYKGESYTVTIFNNKGEAVYTQL